MCGGRNLSLIVTVSIKFVMFKDVSKEFVEMVHGLVKCLLYTHEDMSSHKS